MRSVGDATALFIQGKGRDEKTVKLPDHVESAIRKYLIARKATNEQEALFVSYQ